MAALQILRVCFSENLEQNNGAYFEDDYTVNILEQKSISQKELNKLNGVIKDLIQNFTK